MIGCVLDASALLASLLEEPGHQIVDDHLVGAAIVSVNLAEVVGYFARRGKSVEHVRAAIERTGIEIAEADAGLAYEAGMLLPITRGAGLSLGDRFCLALARRRDYVALTADRAWPDVAEKAGVKVELIR